MEEGGYFPGTIYWRIKLQEAILWGKFSRKLFTGNDSPGNNFLERCFHVAIDNIYKYSNNFFYFFFCNFIRSRPNVFCKKGFLRNFTKYTGKHLCQSLFLNKVTALTPATLLKKRLWHRYFPADFVKFLRTPFYREHVWWLLL